MTDVEKKVSKLLRHAESAKAVGSLAEAEAFAAKAQELMMEHAIEVTVDSYDEPVTDPMGTTRLGPDKVTPDTYKRGGYGKRSAWREGLARIVANANFCGFLVTTGTSTISFYGKKSHRESAAEVFLALLYVAERLRKRDVAEERKYYGYTPEGFTASWREGFLAAIREKMHVTRQRITEQLKLEGNTTALVRLDQHRTDLREYSAGRWGRRAARLGGSASGYNATGYSAGYRAGKGASTAPSTHKRLGSD